MLSDRNRLFYERNAGSVVLDTGEAIRLGATGPVLRGCGYPMYIRKFSPYLKYDEVEFDVPTRLEGDNLARYYVRMEEMGESIKIIQQCLQKMPAGPIRTENGKPDDPTQDEA